MTDKPSLDSVNDMKIVKWPSITWASKNEPLLNDRKPDIIIAWSGKDETVYINGKPMAIKPYVNTERQRETYGVTKTRYRRKKTILNKDKQ